MIFKTTTETFLELCEMASGKSGDDAVPFIQSVEALGPINYVLVLPVDDSIGSKFKRVVLITSLLEGVISNVPLSDDIQEEIDDLQEVASSIAIAEALEELALTYKRAALTISTEMAKKEEQEKKEEEEVQREK